MSIATTQIRREDARVTGRLLKLLAEDTDWLFTLRFEMGCAWLDQQYGPETEKPGGGLTLRGLIERSTMFWGWWKNHWHTRDQHLEARWKTEQLNSGEWVLALYDSPTEPIADKLFYAEQQEERRAFYRGWHKAQAWALHFDGDLLRLIERQARLESLAKDGKKPKSAK